MIAVGVGYLPAGLCSLLAWGVGLRTESWRARRHRRRTLAFACAATAAMLVVMASPLGWEPFDWYVS